MSSKKQSGTSGDRKQNTEVIIELTYSECCYFRITAMNRFLDNVEKALKGDEECRNQLLAEDLEDARSFYNPVFRKIQEEV